MLKSQRVGNTYTYTQISQRVRGETKGCKRLGVFDSRLSALYEKPL